VKKVTNLTCGDTIKVCSGSYNGGLVDKSVVIRGAGQAVISGGPAHPSGFIMGFGLLAGSGGTEISHFTFEVEFPVMNREGVDNVVVAHNTLLFSVENKAFGRQ
jgi:hypothetical protein